MSNIASAPKVTQTQNLEVEQGLLGCLLLRGDRVNDILDILKPEHFADPLHAEIYKAIVGLHSAGQTYDALTVSSYIYGDSWTERNGGTLGYLTDLVNWLPTPSVQAKDYAITIRRLYTNREIENATNDKRLTATERANVMQEIMQDANDFELQRQSFYTSRESIAVTLNRIDEVAKNGGFLGIRTGFPELDEMLCGLDGGGLYVVAGRPAMGKTAFALTTAVNVALQGLPVLFFTLEMSHHQLQNRLLARFSKVSMKEQRSGMPYGGFEKLTLAQEKISDLPLDIEDISGQTAAQISARARQDMLRKRYKMIVIDHLAIVKDPQYVNNKVQALAQTTAEFKSLAKSLDVPVLLLHQLNRSVETRDDKRPSLADLRDGGSVEQDADAVMMLYRPEYYMKNEPVRKPGERIEAYNERVTQWFAEMEQIRGKAEVLIEKNRQGETGKVVMNFHGVWQMFSEG